MRLTVPVNHDENEKSKSENPSRSQSEYAKLKEKISQTIERITELDKSLAIHNRRKDEIDIDELSEIEALIDDSDSDDGSGEMINESDIDDPSDEETLLTDREFSLEYGFTVDVSGK